MFGVSKPFRISDLSTFRKYIVIYLIMQLRMHANGCVRLFHIEFVSQTLSHIKQIAKL